MTIKRLYQGDDGVVVNVSDPNVHEVHFECMSNGCERTKKFEAHEGIIDMESGTSSGGEDHG
jgi:hypothetical protein